MGQTEGKLRNIGAKKSKSQWKNPVDDVTVILRDLSSFKFSARSRKLFLVKKEDMTFSFCKGYDLLAEECEGL